MKRYTLSIKEMLIKPTLRHRFTPTGVATIKNTGRDKYSQGHRTTVHSWQEYTTPLLWKTVWRRLKKYKENYHL